MSPDGSHVQRVTDGHRDNSPAFSADGQWIVYRSNACGGNCILKVSINGGPPVRLTERLSGAPAVSPDGKTIAFTYRQTALGLVKIAVLPFDGSGEVKMIESRDVPRRLLLQWTSDGQAIAYVKTGGSTSNIWLQPLNNDPPRQLTSFDSELIFNFAFAPDGRLAVTRGHDVSDVVLISSLN